MKANEIISAVRSSAGIDTYDQAEKAVKAMLTVLGQRLSTEAGDLAAQLPRELGDQLIRNPEVERFSLEEFYRRVAEEEGGDCTPPGGAPACPGRDRRIAGGRGRRVPPGPGPVAE